MGTEGSGRNVRVRVSARRDFLPGLNSVHRSAEDFPSECAPICPKSAEICPKTAEICHGNSGVCDSSQFWRRRVGAVRSKPSEIPRKRVRNDERNDEQTEQNSGFSGCDYSHWRRHVFAIRSKPPLNPEMSVKNPLPLQVKEVPKTLENVPKNPKSKPPNQREKLLSRLELFREKCKSLILAEKSIKRVDARAYKVLKSKGKIVKQPASIIGSIPGVEVGDKFQYRMELLIVGLHRLPQNGIDYMEFRGRKLATCIVAKEGHFDKLNDPNVLIYVGEGGGSRVEDGVPDDQEPEKGNRALLNSMKEKNPVRVVRGLKLERCGLKRRSGIVYVYDGLYEVEGCVHKKGPQGNMIFEFRLVRCGGQPAIAWKKCRWSRF